MNAMDRLFDKCTPEPNTGCFIWLGSTDDSGYGRIAYEGHNMRASRVSWLLHKGAPGDLHVLHRCDNRLCVNPGHLFLGTNYQNVMDKAVKGRVRSAKLNPEKVREIRALRADQMPVPEIARRYGVDRGCIYRVLRGEVWAHVA